MIHIDILQGFDTPDLIHPIPDAYTVVIFSSPIKDWFKRLGTGVLHISWPSQKKYQNENGTRLASTIFICLTLQLQVKKYLRIVCIDALDSNGELSGETAKNVLDYLAKSIKTAQNKSVIDVILLPCFNSKVIDPGGIMELLWDLRKRTVVISDSSLHSSLPGTETIAVSGATKLQNTPASVVDFVVTARKTLRPPSISDTDVEAINLYKEWINIEFARAMASGVVAAISLGIQSCLQNHFAESLKSKIYLGEI